VVLEPVGGQVFDLEVRETTLFNAYQMVGVLAGMLLSGQFLANKASLYPSPLPPSLASRRWGCWSS